METLAVRPPAKGRPREFDVDEALVKALHVFWRHGYESASMADLTEAMGITKPSLYAAFGNKEALFRKALDLYEREKMAYVGEALRAPTARAVAERLMRGALAMTTSSCDPKGCLGVISSVTCGAENGSIKAEVAQRRAFSQAALAARFEQARRDGDIPDGVDPQALARYLSALMQGMAVQAGTGVPTEELTRLVDMALAIWPSR